MRFRGSYVALITPFDQKGRIDKKNLEKLVDWHVSQGTDGIVCCGTTGEGTALSEQERKTIARVCLDVAQERIQIIVSTGVSDTKTTLRYTEAAQKMGAAGCLVVTPYYNKPSQRGCLAHFTEVAKVGLPVIVYHNPPRAVVRLTAETILDLAKVPYIAAIKESSHDLSLISQIAKHIDVLAGDDDLTFSIMKEGGVGAISAVGNLIPRGWKQLISFCLEKKWEAAEYLSNRYLPLIKALFLETNPQGIKYGLACLGGCTETLRLPMVVPMLRTQIEIKKALLHLALPQFNVADDSRI